MGYPIGTKPRQFTKEFKIQVVQEYLNGEDGSTNLGKKYGIDDSVIGRWISAYRAKGEDAFNIKKGPAPGKPQKPTKPKSDDKDELIRYLQAEVDILKKLKELQRRDARK